MDGWMSILLQNCRFLHNFWYRLILPILVSSPMSFVQILYDSVLYYVLFIESKRSFTIIHTRSSQCCTHLSTAPHRVSFVHNKLLFISLVFAFSFLSSLQQWHIEALHSPSVALSSCPTDTITYIPPCCHSPQSPARKCHGTICFAQKWDIYHCWTPARNREWTGVGFITVAGSH